MTRYGLNGHVVTATLDNGVSLGGHFRNMLAAEAVFVAMQTAQPFESTDPDTMRRYRNFVQLVHAAEHMPCR